MIVELYGDFTAVEACLVHGKSRLLSIFAECEFYDAKASRTTFFVETHRGVVHFAELRKSVLQLAFIDGVGQVAHVNREALSTFT